MSFASPWLLLGLVLVPLLVLAYAVTERRRRRGGGGVRRAADRALGRAAAAGLAPPRAASRSPALAMAGLVVALARPQVSVAVPAEQASIVLTMDHSGSMQATDVAPSRLVAAREAGEAFLARGAREGAGRRRRLRPPHARRSRTRRPTAPRCATRCATR